MEEIRIWLEDSTYYWQGVELYKKHIGGGFMLTMLNQGDDEYNRAQLYEKLGKLVEAHTEKEIEIKNAYPEELQGQLTQAQNLMDERADLKAQLRRSWRQGEPAKERQPLALRVLEIKQEIDHIYATEKYFNSMKALPKDDFDVEDEIAGLMKRRNTVRTYVSRYRLRTESKKYREYNDELFQLTEKLRILGVTFQD